MTLRKLLPIFALAMILANAYLASPWITQNPTNQLLGILILLGSPVAFAVAGHRCGTRHAYLTGGLFAGAMIAIWLLGPAGWAVVQGRTGQGFESLRDLTRWVMVGGNLAVFALAWYFGARLRKAAFKAVQKAIRQAETKQQKTRKTTSK